MATLNGQYVLIRGLNREEICDEFLKIFNEDFFKTSTTLDMDLILEIPELEHLSNIGGGLGLVSQFITELVKDIVEKKTRNRPELQCYLSNYAVKIRQKISQ